MKSGTVAATSHLERREEIQVIRLGASPTKRARVVWRGGQWRKRRWGVELAQVKWHRRAGLAQRPTFCQPGWSCPEQPAFLSLLGGCSVDGRELWSLVQRDDSARKPCLQPAILAVAGESTLCELQVSCAPAFNGLSAGGSPRDCGSFSTSTDSNWCCCCSCTCSI